MSLAVQGRMKTAVRIREDLMKDFQYWVRRGFGKLKGAQEAALNDAVKLWVSLVEGGVDVWFGYTETVDGLSGYRVLTMQEFLEVIPTLKEANLRVVQGSMRPPILKKVLELNPDKVVIREGHERREVEDPERMLDELFKRITSGSNVELCLIWSRERRVAFFDRERFSVGGEIEYGLASRGSP